MLKEKWNTNWTFWNVRKDALKLRVNLPHDAMLTEKRLPKLKNGNATGFYPGGKYVYTKTLFGKQEYQDKAILLEFEGIYMKSTVYLNGEEAGGWVYGYSNFYVDLTGKLRINEENEIKVVVDNSQTPNSRWYSGSGIYRHVNLWIGEKQHIIPDGVKVTTVNYDPAEILISVESVKDSQTTIECDIAFEGSSIACLTGGVCSLTIPHAKLWDDKNPHLYDLKVTLKKGDIILDEADVKFGIRKIEWDAKDGLRINGNTIKLCGGCVHHDNGPLGACAYDKAEYRKARKLKELGYNAIRYSHNPSSKAFLEACDELGLYVLDETFDQWKMPQSTYDYALYFEKEWKKDVSSLIRKDYNHPSVIMYCIGNEITDTGLPSGGQICKEINDLFHELDATRPTTIAINGMLSVLAAKMAEKQVIASPEDEVDPYAEEGEQEATGSAAVNDLVTLLPKIRESITSESLEALIKECTANVDIVGYNYGENLYEGIHELIPDRVILSSETFPSKLGSNWEMVRNSPYVIGDFMWTAWDYLGEAGVGLPVYGVKQAAFSKAYPCVSAGCGSVDMTGFADSQAFYSSIVWEQYKKPYIGVRPVNHAGEDYFIGLWRLTDAVNSWTWPGQEGKTAQIEVYSIGDSIELFQDGVSLGKKKLKESKAYYETAYYPGKLEAVSYDLQGTVLGSSELKTAGSLTMLTLIAEDNKIKADGEDLAYVAVHITDEEGILKMLTEYKVCITVEGAGELAAVGSGNPETMEKFTDNTYTTYHGRMIAIVRNNGTSGKIRITASADGLLSRTIEIISE